MKIIIDIPEKIIKHIETQELTISELDQICKAVQEGEPLPQIN